jgi:hypothetical protein
MAVLLIDIKERRWKEELKGKNTPRLSKCIFDLLSIVFYGYSLLRGRTTTPVVCKFLGGEFILTENEGLVAIDKKKYEV